jgi:hypothetical protein
MRAHIMWQAATGRLVPAVRRTEPGPGTDSTASRLCSQAFSPRAVVASARAVFGFPLQLGVSVGEALIRIRAHAFSHGLRVDDVALAVVDRQLRFDSS